MIVIYHLKWNFKRIYKSLYTKFIITAKLIIYCWLKYNWVLGKSSEFHVFGIGPLHLVDDITVDRKTFVRILYHGKVGHSFSTKLNFEYWQSIKWKRKYFARKCIVTKLIWNGMPRMCVKYYNWVVVWKI